MSLCVVLSWWKIHYVKDTTMILFYFVHYTANLTGPPNTALAVPSPLGPTLPVSTILLCCYHYACSICVLCTSMPGPPNTASAVPSPLGPTLPGIIICVLPCFVCSNDRLEVWTSMLFVYLGVDDSRLASA